MKKILLGIAISLLIMTTVSAKDIFAEGIVWLYDIEPHDDTEVVIYWPGEEGGDPIITPSVKYGTDKNNLDMEITGKRVPNRGIGGNVIDYTHRVTLRNLTPDTKYYFKMVIEAEGIPGAVPTESRTLSFSTDFTPPVVEIISPMEDTVLTGIVRLELTATDNVGVTKAGFDIEFDRQATKHSEPFPGPDTLKEGIYHGDSYTHDEKLRMFDNKPLGEELVFDTPPYAADWDTTQFKDGVYEIRAWAWGGLGGEKKIKVRVDNLPPDTTIPTVSIVSPQDGATVYGKVKIIANATDNHKINKVQFFINGRKSEHRFRPPYEKEWDTTRYDPGEYRLQAKATDKSKNVGESETITVTVIETSPDTTPPTPK